MASVFRWADVFMDSLSPLHPYCLNSLCRCPYLAEVYATDISREYFCSNLRCRESVRFGRMCPYTCPSLYLDTCKTCEKWVALILMRVFVVAPVMAS